MSGNNNGSQQAHAFGAAINNANNNNNHSNGGGGGGTAAPNHSGGIGGANVAAGHSAPGHWPYGGNQNSGGGGNNSGGGGNNSGGGVAAPAGPAIGVSGGSVAGPSNPGNNQWHPHGQVSTPGVGSGAPVEPAPHGGIGVPIGPTHEGGSGNTPDGPAGSDGTGGVVASIPHANKGQSKSKKESDKNAHNGQVNGAPGSVVAPTVSPTGGIAAPAPGPDQPRAKGAPGAGYVVQPGDTLSGIAAAHGIPLARLEALNPQIKDFNLIHPGESINLGGLPAKGGAGPAGAPAPNPGNGNMWGAGPVPDPAIHPPLPNKDHDLTKKGGQNHNSTGQGSIGDGSKLLDPARQPQTQGGNNNVNRWRDKLRNKLGQSSGAGTTTTDATHTAFPSTSTYPPTDTHHGRNELNNVQNRLEGGWGAAGANQSPDPAKISTYLDGQHQNTDPTQIQSDQHH